MKFGVRIGLVTRLMPIQIEFDKDSFNRDN